MATRNPSGFLDPIRTRQFPGSSGYWWSSPTNAVPNQALVDGGLRPGDAARQRIDRGYFLPPGQTSAGGPYTGWGEWWKWGQPGQPGTRFDGTPGPGGGLNDQDYTSVVHPKFGNVAGLDFNAMIGGYGKALNDVPLPKYTNTLNEVQKAQETVPAAFDEYGKALDTSLAHAQTDFDPRYSSLTSGYAGIQRGIGGGFNTATNQYTAGLADITARDYAGAQEFNQGQQDLYNRIAAENAKQFSKFNMGTNSNAGLSSAALGGLINSNSRAALDLELAGIEYNRRAREAEQGRLGLAQGAEQARAGFLSGQEQNIYGQQRADIDQAQRRQEYLQRITQEVGGLRLDAALRKSPALLQAAQAVSAAYNLSLDDIMKRAQTTEGLLRLLSQANYTGVELRGGANVSQPVGYDMTGLPNRYAPPIRTGNDLGRGTNSGQADIDRTAPGPNFGGLTDLQRAQAYAAGAQYQPQRRLQAPSYGENYGPPTETGWGYINGRYTGAGADEWNAPWPPGT